MEKITLGSGLEICRLVTGLWQVADMERKQGIMSAADCAAALHKYVEAGATSIDMADHYGSAELIVGEYIKQQGGTHENIQVFTKWVPKPGPVSREQTREAVELSLERLGVKSIDLLQFHAWTFNDPRYIESLTYLQELVDEGLIKHLGVTNFDTAHLRVAVESGIKIVSNQVCYSMLDSRPKTGGMTDYCQANGIKLLCYGVVAGGFLTDKWVGKPAPPNPTDADALTWSQMKYLRFLAQVGGWPSLQILLKALKTVSSKHGVSIANVACRWILDDPEVGGIIVGSRLSKSEHIEENAKAMSLRLDGDDRALLSAAQEEVAANGGSIPGDCGDEYRKPPFLTATGDLSDHLDSFPPVYERTHVSSVGTGDGSSKRSYVLSGTEWEPLAGFSRAVRTETAAGVTIHVSGTTATHGSMKVGGDDPEAQATFVLDKIAAAVESLGGKMRDVVRTRIYVHEVDRDWEPVARAHGKVFGSILPANTLVGASLVGDYRVEMEAEAFVPN